MAVMPAPPARLPACQPGLGEIITAFPVATLVVSPDNRIANANVRAETLLNMARSAIIGSDIARTVRMADMGGRFDIWLTDNPLAAYDVQVHAGRTAAMYVDLMIAPIPEHDGWRVVPRQERGAEDRPTPHRGRYTVGHGRGGDPGA